MSNLVDLLVNGIGPNKSIKKLMLNVNGPRAFMDIGRMLEKNESIEDLNVRGELVYDLEGLNLLGKSLRQNKTLRTLSLQLTLGCTVGYNPFYPRYEYPDEICRVSRAVPHGPGSVVGGVCKCPSCFEAFKAVPSTYDVNLDQFFDGIKESSIQDFTFNLHITTSNGGSKYEGYNIAHQPIYKYWHAQFPFGILGTLEMLNSRFSGLRDDKRFEKYNGYLHSYRLGGILIICI